MLAATCPRSPRRNSQNRKSNVMAKKPPRNGKSLVIVESPAKARTIGKFLGSNFTVEASIGHVRDLPQGAKEIPAEFKGEDWAYLGVNVSTRFRSCLYRAARQDGPGSQAQGPAQRRQRPVSGDGRRPRRGGDQLAPARAAQAQGAGASARVSRNHQRSNPRSAEPPARHRQRSGQGAGNAPDSRPALRLRSFAAAVAQGAAQAFGRPRAERGRAADRRARAAADGVHLGDLLGSDGARWPTPAEQEFQAELVSVDGRAIPAGKDFDSATGKLKNHKLPVARRVGRRPIWPSGCRPPTSAWPASKTSRSPQNPRPPSPRARCSRKPTASSASPPAAR